MPWLEVGEQIVTTESRLVIETKLARIGDVLTYRLFVMNARGEESEPDYARVEIRDPNDSGPIIDRPPPDSETM